VEEKEMGIASRWMSFAFWAVLLLGPNLALTPRVQAAPPIRAPELEGGTGWIGTDENITLKSLRGKIVVFDFWTLC
jgi:hypothetical protein